jgi:hypothetical protein
MRRKLDIRSIHFLGCKRVKDAMNGSKQLIKRANYNYTNSTSNLT